MSKRVHFASAVIVTLLACSAAGAQTRGGASPNVSVARVAPMRMAPPARGSGLPSGPAASGAHGPRQARVIQVAPSGRVTSGTGSFENSANFADQNGVPGLGFDYPHLAAVGGNFPGNPPSFGRDSHRQDNFITPVFFGGFPYYSDYPDYQQEQQQPQVQQPQVIVIQQPVPAASVQQPAPVAQETPTASAPTISPAPVPEVGEFVLVRRDGRVLFASAFFVTSTQVQYVTPEGIRRTLPLPDLDTVATQDMNEARGTTLQFHN
jgi:hypothetical protein